MLLFYAVPISVIAAFKKIKALVHNNSLLANALRTSSKLVSLWHDFIGFSTLLAWLILPSFFLTSENGWHCSANTSTCWMLYCLQSGQVVSDDGKKVRRQQPFTEADVEELQVTFSYFPTRLPNLNYEPPLSDFPPCSHALLLLRIYQRIIVTRTLWRFSLLLAGRFLCNILLFF